MRDEYYINSMSVFTFDEELFAAGVNNLKIDDAAAEVFSLSPTAYHPISESPRTNFTRRRSSVYRRLSVRSLVSHGNIAIPTDYVTDLENQSPFSYKRTLADFEPLKVLGQGAYGKVHLVRDRVNGKLYAQKQIRKPQIDVFEEKLSPHVHRTLAERHILSQITHHVNIVKLFYALHDTDKCYLMLEYIPGGELFHHLTSNNSLGNVFLELHVAFYAAQMALGLRHLHRLGIVYRDLKPENCLLNANGHLVLTDFGLSKAIGPDDDPECRLIIGTPEYMAPEIIKGEPYDYAVDWWLLGCVIYDMMTGKPPFTGKTHQAILDKIVKAKVSLPHYLSLDAKDLVNKLLQKSPAKRMKVDDKWDVFKQHRFFRKVEWAAVEDQLAVPPVVPVISDPALAENFSLDFTNMKILDYDLGEGQRGEAVELAFRGFSYTASHSYIERYL